jgi:hypothetical protein
VAADQKDVLNRSALRIVPDGQAPRVSLRENDVCEIISHLD